MQTVTKANRLGNVAHGIVGTRVNIVNGAINADIQQKLMHRGPRVRFKILA